MGKRPRVGLVLGACAMLLAVLIDWVLEEMAGSRPVLRDDLREAAPSTSGEPTPAPAPGDAPPATTASATELPPVPLSPADLPPDSDPLGGID